MNWYAWYSRQKPFRSTYMYTYIALAWVGFDWMGFEPIGNEFRSDALTDWPIRLWVSIALRKRAVLLFKILAAQFRSNKVPKGPEYSNYCWSKKGYISVVSILLAQHWSQLNKIKKRKCNQYVYGITLWLINSSDRFQSRLRAFRYINLNINISEFTVNLRVH